MLFKALIITLQIVFLSCLAEALAETLYNISHNPLIAYNPLINGFVHRDTTHFAYNLLLLFFVFLHQINSRYGLKHLILLTALISSLYFPFVILGFSANAIGLSGCCSFLMTRAMLSSGTLCRILWLLIFVSELLQLGFSDTSAHGIHLIGLALGWLSLRHEKPINNILFSNG
jgi:hypothetical protein